MALPGEGAVGGLQAAFLIDADNFSDSVALNAAWLQVQARTGRGRCLSRLWWCAAFAYVGDCLEQFGRAHFPESGP